KISIRSMRMVYRARPSAASRIELFEPLLQGRSLAIRPNRRLGIGPRAPAGDEVLPRCDPPRLKIVHEIPQRGPQHMMREAREPRDIDAERPVPFQHRKNVR